MTGLTVVFVVLAVVLTVPVYAFAVQRLLGLRLSRQNQCMSDAAQVFVAIDCEPDEAHDRAAKAIDWLVAQGIVRRELTECVWASRGGHPPGPRFESALDERDLAGAAATLRLLTNGVAAIVGRTVFDSGGDGMELTCPLCGFDQPLREWSGPWGGVGNLALEFWNWPRVMDAFIEQLAAVLGGRMRVVRCRV